MVIPRRTGYCRATITTMPKNKGRRGFVVVLMVVVIIITHGWTNGAARERGGEKRRGRI